MTQTLKCPDCNTEIKIYTGPTNSSLYIAGETYDMHCNHCLGEFEVFYDGDMFAVVPEKKSLTKALDEAVKAAEQFEKVLKEGTVAKVSEKTNQRLIVKYYDGTECTITYDKPVRLWVNDIFGTVKVYDENDDCLFYTSKSLVRTVMLLSSDDKIATGYMPSKNEVAKED